MIRQIKYFQSVVKNNSFSEAAEECHISQSAVSQQVRALENELGFDLLLRKNRRFELTQAGEYFYRKSLILTADYERICRESLSIANNDEKVLRIGALKGYMGNELYGAVRQFALKYPDIDIQTEYGNHEELYTLLRTGRADVVFNDQRRAFSDEYINIILAELKSYIEISSADSIAKLEKVGPSELKNTPCIIVCSKAQQNDEWDYYCNTLGFEGEYIFAESIEEARMLIVSGKGFMPVDMAKVHHNGVTAVVPLFRNERQMSKNYCLFRRADHKNREYSERYISDFVEILKEQFEK